MTRSACARSCSRASEYSFGRQNWFDLSASEEQATRERVAVFDQTSFSKYVLKGRDAESVLNYLCTADMSVPVGRAVYTGMLNERGGYESDFTATRTGVNEAGEKFGLADGGYYAIESMRLEKGCRAWSRELTPDYTPVEAGLVFACKLNTGTRGTASLPRCT